ncbi:SIMPL domain-containing protein [Flavilitoribacter nigricans]|uniref:DUF541 domain-containing protein n=1 Tax=Flavilitoribacter nigricans (strain ATCC 23147 / DSM 23189 / NBRC 102662 / NCIMB 1420 / SS-2) TaxID=1122177 RepID=A0A2D0NH11_FLAN2|nr:SIMPL domain-containing protein [Flavilitoribacter nigricans]PHN07670.1 hypothetical protein CRP01_06105 [Flavilitoribacter nigricans DSM 23189 = NBRC 102662]
MVNYRNRFEAIFLLITASLFLFSCSRPAAATDKPGANTMLIKATGEIEAVPDMATFSIDLTCQRRNAKDAKVCLLEQSDDLTTTLLSLGIERADLQTTVISMHKNYNWTKSTRVFAGYNGTTSMIVTVRNIDLLDTLYTELLDNRDLQIGYITYAHSDMDSLRALAYLEALQQADVLSQKLLQELSLEQKKIRNIANVDISARTAAVRNASELVEEAQATSNVQDQSMTVHSGLIKIRAQLFVDYWIS